MCIRDSIYTPLQKLFASEYANEITYDALQIHGGSGFMKDYPIQRLVRDARITNIYEGTSQLQVVAAIRGVTTGQYAKHIREVYEKAEIAPETEYLREQLKGMTEQLETATQTIGEVGNTEYTDFHARRLVEMAGYTIIGCLLYTSKHVGMNVAADCFMNAAITGDVYKRQSYGRIYFFHRNIR